MIIFNNCPLEKADVSAASVRLSDSPLRGTADCPLIINCPKKGTAECPYAKSEAAATSVSKKEDESPACCKKKH